MVKDNLIEDINKLIQGRKKIIYADPLKVSEFEINFPNQNWKKELSNKLEHFNKYPFKNKNLDLWLHTIKRNIRLINPLGKFDEDNQDQKLNPLIYEFLTNPDLFSNIIKEFDKKIKGEKKSKRSIFLSLCSIWIDGSEVPLNTFVSSESSVGKSFVCKRIVKIFPKELVQYRSKITPEAFTYWHNTEDDWTWDGKICYLEDISQSILEAPTFKVMCSEGSIATIVSKHKAIDIEIKGKPVMLITTARTNPNTEILNRFQIVSLDESSQQTESIVFDIATKAEKNLNIDYDPKISEALGCLKRRKVKIPFAVKIAQFLKENYNFKSIRLRRDFSRLLDLVKSSAVLHQYQREVDEEENIIANSQDYEIARECINYVQTQTFRGLTHKLKKALDCCLELKEFTAKDIHSRFPFVNQKMWYNYLDELLERGLLKTEVREQTGEKSDGKLWKVKTTWFIALESSNFELPEFNILPENITMVTINTKDTKDTMVTKDIKKEANDCNDCNDFIKKPQKKREKQLEEQISKDLFQEASQLD